MKKLIPSEMRSRTISNILVVAAGMGMLAVLMYFGSIWSVATKIVNRGDSTSMPHALRM